MTSKDDVRALYKNFHDIFDLEYAEEERWWSDLTSTEGYVETAENRYYPLPEDADNIRHAEATFEIGREIADTIDQDKREIERLREEFEELRGEMHDMRNRNRSVYKKNQLVQYGVLLGIVAEDIDPEPENCLPGNPFTTGRETYEEEILEFSQNIVDALSDEDERKLRAD